MLSAVLGTVLSVTTTAGSPTAPNPQPAVDSLQGGAVIDSRVPDTVNLYATAIGDIPPSVTQPTAHTGGPPPVICYFAPRTDYQPAPPDVQPPGPGMWMERRCTSGAVDTMGRVLMPLIGEILWVPQGSIPPTAAQFAAQAAYKQLKMPTPALELSPAATATQYAELPTWLALDPASWKPVAASAAVPGLTVTATATPVSVTWSMGDGTTERCSGPGTVYSATSDPMSASPTCGHVYRHSSADQRDLRFPVIATVSWQVNWRATNGETGTLPPLTSTASTSVQVAEVQALVTTGPAR